MRKRAKYGNRKIEIDGFIFDSKLEGRYYEHLKQLKQTKKISEFAVKPPALVLQKKFVKNGKAIRAITYEPDFYVIESDNLSYYVDTKGVLTTDFKLKEKLFHYKYQDLELRLLTYVAKRGGWIDIRENERLKKIEQRKNT